MIKSSIINAIRVNRKCYVISFTSDFYNYTTLNAGEFECPYR